MTDLKEESSKTGLLIGNGPSLNDVPIDFLRQYDSYGANGIFYLEGFVPTYYFCSDVWFLENHWKQIASITGKVKEAWIRWPYHARFGYGARPLHRLRRYWGYSPDVAIGYGGNILYQCLQVAYWHKVQTLLVVGLDHDYFEWKEFPKHFDSRYQRTDKLHPTQGIPLGSEELTQYGQERKEATNVLFQQALDIFEADERRIINLTEDSQCDVFERGNVDDWIVDNSS